MELLGYAQPCVAHAGEVVEVKVSTGQPGFTFIPASNGGWSVLTWLDTSKISDAAMPHPRAQRRCRWIPQAVISDRVAPSRFTVAQILRNSRWASSLPG